MLCRDILSTRNKDYLTLHCRALELVGKVIKHVGFEYLQDNVNPILEDMVIVRGYECSFCIAHG